MSKILTEVSNRKATPQTERAQVNQVENSAGGFVFEVNLWDRVRRFLVLGVDSGTFYVQARALAKENAGVISEAVRVDVKRLVAEIVEVSDKALAPKNSPALFALAIALTEAADEDKALVRDAVNKVARTGTHLFEFAQYVENLGGWGRSKRKALASWYEDKDADQLAFQAVKYRQRNGWTHRDVMRLAHPKGVDARVGNFILKGEVSVDAPNVLQGFEVMQNASTAKAVIDVLKIYTGLPWETIPTEFLKDADVWRTLFYNGALGQTALLRNITRFAKLDMFNDMVFTADVATRLSDPTAIAKGRMHPVAYLNAQGIYEKGQMGRGIYSDRTKTWDTNSKIAGALEAGFYAAFGNVVPAGKRTRLDIDISGSMTWHGPASLVGLDCREAAAAMAMVTLRTEPYTDIRAFSTSSVSTGVSAADSLATVQAKIDRLPMGGTDCSKPMLDALERKQKVDTFVVYTDNETWAGKMQPFQALKKYREEMGINAKLVVVGMVATNFTIADPTDNGMLDVVGFDASAPSVISNFSKA